MKYVTRRISTLAVLLLFAAMGGCDDFLTVENINAPDRERALSEPGDVEALVGSSFFAWWSHLHSLHPMIGLSAAADEITSSRPAFLMRMMGSQPRFEGGDGYPNSSAFAGRGHVERPWYGMYSAISIANDGLDAIEGGLEIGQDGEDTPRTRAFAKLVQGLSHGMIALLFDRGFVVTEDTDLEAGNLEIQPYAAVMEAALAQLDEAIALAEANTFTLPSDWINGLPLSNDELARLARSYKARFMASLPRTPEERAAVDWPEVLQLVEEGIQQDFAPMGDGAAWFNAMGAFGQRANLTRTDYLTLGPADTTGALADWLSKEPQDRQPFLIHTNDRRVTGPAGPKAPGKYFRFYGDPKMPAAFGPYFFSFYHHYRFIDFLRGGRIGPMVDMTMVEMDLLKAEGLLRTNGSAAEVAALINRTRVENGELPPASGGDPVGSWDDWQDAAPDASLWAKLKHEKRLETFGTGVGLAYFDDRGWKDLVRGTHLHLPIPARELLTLQMEIYTFGGSGEWSSQSDVY